jgi:Domain of unknown function DUF11
MIKRKTVRSSARIAAVALVLAVVGSFTTPLASAAPTTTSSADLAVTVTPTFQERINPCCRSLFQFTAVVTNDGPNAARRAVVSVSGPNNAITKMSVAFSVSPQGNCTTSGDTFSCFPLPVGATVKAQIQVTTYCFGHECIGNVTATASSVTPDPIPANNTATGEWEIACFWNCFQV